MLCIAAIHFINIFYMTSVEAFQASYSKSHIVTLYRFCSIHSSIRQAFFSSKLQVLLSLIFYRGSFTQLIRTSAACFGVVSYVVGILIMIFYYSRFHPERRNSAEFNLKSKGLLIVNSLGDRGSVLRHIDSDPDL